MSKRFLITTVGSHGDIHPFIAIGRELASRGHRVRMLVNPYYESLVLDAGLEFEPLGERFDLRELQQTDIMHPTRGTRVVTEMLIFNVVPATLDSFERIMADFKPDVVLHHHICFAIASICDRFNVLRASASLAPLMWLNRKDPLVAGKMQSELPGWMRPAFSLVFRIVSRQLFDRPLNRLLRERGYPPVHDVWTRLTLRGDAVLGLWSPHFRHSLDGDPPNSAICGCPTHDRAKDQEHASEELESYLREPGGAPIVFTLGTAAVQVPGDYYEVAAEACRRVGRRGLLLVGRGPGMPRTLPPNVRAFTYAPFSQLLPRAALTVHHGGVGTTHAAMRAGRPMIVVPHAHDQYDNAARVRRLGVSETISRARLRVHRLESMLRKILETPRYVENAASLAKRMSDENGAVIAADRLEQMANQG